MFFSISKKDVNMTSKKRSAHNTGYSNNSSFSSPSLFPASLSGIIKNLRLWGVFCASSESVIFSAVKRSDCERFLKSVPSFASAGLYLIRFDSAY